MPQGLACNNAITGVPTVATNFTFPWGAPQSDGGIAGYSVAFDQTPFPAINNFTVSSSFNSVQADNHAFRVMALGNNGLWGQPAVFNLIVISFAPNIVISR
jgi:hypothetical protein